MATYNGTEFINVQISSILNQLKDDDEVVVIDDASTDDTVTAINNLVDPRIKLYINDRNIGPALAFDRALSYASGDLIFLSDQDDRWHDGKITTVVKMLETGNLDLVVHDAVVMRAGQVVHASLFEMSGSSSGVIKNIISNTFTGCCMAFRRDILRDVLPISAHIGIFHDAWIGVLAQYFGYKVAFMPVSLMDFIRHGGNASTLKRRRIFPIILDRVAFVTAIALQIVRVYFRRLMNFGR